MCCVPSELNFEAASADSSIVCYCLSIIYFEGIWVAVNMDTLEWVPTPLFCPWVLYTTVYVLAYTGLLVAPIIALSSPGMQVHTYRYAGMIPHGVKVNMRLYSW